MLFSRAFAGLLIVSLHAALEANAAPGDRGVDVTFPFLGLRLKLGDKCMKSSECCEGLECRDGTCQKPQVCVANGEKCGGDRGDCCEGLECVEGACKAKADKCLVNGKQCDINDPGACCSGTCSAQDGCI